MGSLSGAVVAALILGVLFETRLCAEQEVPRTSHTFTSYGFPPPSKPSSPPPQKSCPPKPPKPSPPPPELCTPSPPPKPHPPKPPKPRSPPPKPHTPTPPKPRSPPPPTRPEKCPIFLPKLLVCAPVVKSLKFGFLPLPFPCCFLVNALSYPQAKACACAAGVKGFLGLYISIPGDIAKLLAFCGKSVPAKFSCD